MVLAASRKNSVKLFKVATLQRQAHLQPCNVPFREVIKFGESAEERPFQKCSRLPRAQNLLAGRILIGSPVKSAFALLLTRVIELSGRTIF